MRIITIIILALCSTQSWAQCTDPDKSIWENTWESCQPSQSPNPARGMGHWVQYEFDSTYTLTHTQIWNTNEVGKTANGFQKVIVDYSEDGLAWTELGTYDFPQASGEARYGGFEGFNFEGKTAKYVLLTALSNWGGNCYGLAEVKFNIQTQSGVNNPAVCRPPTGIEVSNIQSTSVFIQWNAVQEATAYLVIIISDQGEQEYEVNQAQITLSGLQPNTFYEIEVASICNEDESGVGFSAFTTTISTDTNNLPEQEVSNLILIPNPATENVTLSFKSSISGLGMIQLRSVTGALLQSQSIEIRNGENSFPLSIQGLPTGVYLVSFNHPKHPLSITRRLVVMNK